MRITIRWMIRRDLAEVLAIESDVFEFPWDEDAFIRCLRERNCIGMVAEDERDKIVGYMIYELQKNSFELRNFAVAAEHWRKGVGTAMADKMKSKLTQRKRLLLEIRESNLDAQLFFYAQGFKAVKVLRDFYDDTSEDACTFSYRVTEVRQAN